ncbi:hypothetical protein CXB51_015142 [Gossypium anomalum]|uniref:Reverse transcriptase Ty1/copia-type domain-containing protein n=1 Tax=Gossypium anomalum TaxID=47600 RepID=A0A8J5ZM25_9ROSI|nr:hypothetical protein CXB51_015142 [Gossypium anomalum]
MQQPLGYVKCDSNGTPFVCHLKKALYRLRQALRAWFEKLKQFLISIGFVGSNFDASLFVRIKSGSTFYVLVYVDDIIITRSLTIVIDWFVRLLNDKFLLKDMGDLHYFLGIEVTHSSESQHLCQKKYIRDILDQCSMTDAKSVHTLMVSSSTMSKDDGECLEDPIEYRSLAGELQYVILTQPDIAYAVNRVCQFMHNPTTVYMVALKRSCSICMALLSLGFFFVHLLDCLWLDMSMPTGTKYRSLAGATNEVTWLLSLFQELQVKSDDTPIVWCDNSSAVAVAANPMLNSKFKHVELDMFFVREKVADGSVLVGEVPTCDQVADVFTKPLSVTSFTRFRNLLQVFPVGKMGEC